MLQSFLLVAAILTSEPVAVHQSKNGEFIFSQYPPRALARGEQGSVRFRAEADAKGNVLSCKVTASSGYEQLDRETCDLMVDHATFAPTLSDDGKPRAAVHDGIINWRIPGRAPAAPKSASAQDLDEIVCKRTPKTGSLIAHSRLCKTRREWSQYADRNQAEWGELQGIKGSTREDQPTWSGGSPP